MTFLQSAPRLSSDGRFHGLDTLRAVAILSVMIYHLNLARLLPPALSGIAAVGWAGVDLFFVLSGFLIGSQLLKPYLKGETPSLRDFYARRAYRILPAFLVVLALYYLLPMWREAHGPYAAWQYLSFTWNLFLVGYPDGRAFSHVWSLCVEEHFYLLLPVLVLFLMRRPSARRTAAILLAIVAGGIALRAWVLYHVVLAPGVSEEKQWNLVMRYIYYPTYTRLDGLATGVALALMRSFRPRWWAKISVHGNELLLGGVGVVFMALRLSRFDFPDPSLPWSMLLGFPGLSLGFGLLVASAICERGVLTVRVPGAGWLATLAFSLYLTHKSVGHAVHTLLPSLTKEPDWESAAIYAGSCLTIACLLYFGVERPFLRLRMRRAGRRRTLLLEREVRLDPAL